MEISWALPLGLFICCLVFVGIALIVRFIEFICRITTKPVEPNWPGGIYLEPRGSHETNPFPPPVVEVQRRARSGQQGIYLEPVGGYDTDPFAAQDSPVLGEEKV